MGKIKFLCVLLVFIAVFHQVYTQKEFFEDLNQELVNVNHQYASLVWELSVNSNDAIGLNFAEFMDDKLKWEQLKCQQMKSLYQKFNKSQQRIYELFCNGPKYTNFQQRKLLNVSTELQDIYTTTQICLPKSLIPNACKEADKLLNFTFIQIKNELKQIKFDGNSYGEITPVQHLPLTCFRGEPDLENLMSDDFSLFSSSDDEICMKNKHVIDYWAWEAWRLAIGPRIKEIYPELISVMNEGTKNRGISNVAEIWKSELEIDDAESLMMELWNEVKPLYEMMNALLKLIIHKKYGLSGMLPAHILGWNANWYHLFKNEIAPEIFPYENWNLESELKLSGWTSLDIIKRAEDFYSSMGLSRMTKLFWDKSIMHNNGENSSSCHGTSANMFSTDDYRIIVCGHKSFYDFYVIIHEMGHIAQFMLSENQPGIFRAGNPIIQEAFGDSIFLASMAPIHLNRLHLIEDRKLFPSIENDFDLYNLMMMAFAKIPDIPFGLVFEKFRWELFAGHVKFDQANDYFWDLTRNIQDMKPPNWNFNRHKLFDAAAKFHLATNVPYSRYFFADILQYQIFRGLCEITVYGRLNTNQSLPMPLNKCDIYGSKRAGNLIKKSLRPGNSISLKTILKKLTGTEKISADALKEYYQPLVKWLENYLKAHNIKY